MANTLASPSYVFSFKLVSGYNQITSPNNVIVPNLKQIIVRKLSYSFNQQYQYEAKLSIVGYDYTLILMVKTQVHIPYLFSIQVE